MNVLPNNTIYWREYDAESSEIIQQACIEIVLRIDDNIIGYAVIGINKVAEDYGDYKANVLKSVYLPILNGEYQNISNISNLFLK